MLKFRNSGSRFEVLGNEDHFFRIVNDMIENGGELAPSDHWNWNLGNKSNNLNCYTEETFYESYSSLEKMLNPWVGISGMKPVSEASVDKYEKFLREIDHLELLPDEISNLGKSERWLETDLGSILDVNLISAFLSKSEKDSYAVCEVGGGYGRLAEVFLSLFDGGHYVLIDAVPGSLMYSYLYLKRQFPELKIGSFYNDDKYCDKFDCYILPAWRTDLLKNSSFDICINIESMQEMEQYHVDFYLKLFDRLTVTYGHIYLSNARDYVFKGDWKIPFSWETLYLNNTPRSWTPDHPTHILRKTENEDCELRRKLHESAFVKQIMLWDRENFINKINLELAEQKVKYTDLLNKQRNIEKKSPQYKIKKILEKLKNKKNKNI